MTATNPSIIADQPAPQILPNQISVIMVSFYTGPSLFKAVQSVMDDPDIFELIIIDNGNRPDFRAKISDMLHRGNSSPNGPNVRLIQGHGNIGFGRACNYGASVSRGEYLLFLNPDAVLERGAAKRLAACGYGLKTPWITGGYLQTQTGQEQRGGRRNAVTPWSAVVSFTPLHRLPRFTSLHLERTPKPDQPLAMPIVSGAFMMLNQRGFAALNGFNPKYFLHVEDIDICKRTHDLGGEVYYVPSAQAMHFGSTSQVDLKTVEYQKLKGFVRYFWDYSPKLWAKALLVCCLPPMFCGLMGRAYLLSLRRKFSK